MPPLQSLQRLNPGVATTTARRPTLKVEPSVGESRRCVKPRQHSFDRKTELACQCPPLATAQCVRVRDRHCVHVTRGTAERSWLLRSHGSRRRGVDGRVPCTQTAANGLSWAKCSRS